MRDVAERVIVWVVIVGIIVAIVLGKRRGEQRAQARIDLAVEGAKAQVRQELALGQSVNVAVDASHNGGPAAHQCDNLYACPICAPIALRVLMAVDRGRTGIGGPSASGPARLDDDDHDDDHSPAELSSGVDVGTGRRPAAIELDDGRGAAGDRRAAGDVSDSRGVEVLPCASMSRTVGVSGRVRHG